jgi:hypothetical protein
MESLAESRSDQAAPRLSDTSLRHIQDIQYAAFEDMGALGRALNEERCTILEICDALAEMESLVLTSVVSSEEGRAAINTATKGGSEEGNVADVAVRVKVLLAGCLTRAQHEAGTATQSLERINKPQRETAEPLQIERAARIKVEAQLAEEREVIRHTLVAVAQLFYSAVHV